MVAPMYAMAATGFRVRMGASFALARICLCKVRQIESSYYHGSSSLFNKARSFRRLEKMLTKKRKKFYYDPMNVSQLGRLAGGPNIVKSKTESTDSIRLVTYNKIIFDNITDMMSSGFISEEIQQMQVTVLAVRVSGDMSTCRVYWQATGSFDEDNRIQDVLNRHKGQVRHALISHRVLGRIPPIAFLKDKASANLAELDNLLAVADFGPAEEEEDGTFETDDEADFTTSSGNIVDGETLQPSLFGIDHEAMNRVITDRNKKSPDEVVVWPEEEERQKRFDEFRTSMKTKKVSKAGRRDATFYKGEMDRYRAKTMNDVDLNEDAEMDNNEMSVEDSDLKEKELDEDKHLFSTEQTEHK